MPRRIHSIQLTKRERERKRLYISNIIKVFLAQEHQKSDAHKKKYFRRNFPRRRRRRRKEKTLFLCRKRDEKGFAICWIFSLLDTKSDGMIEKEHRCTASKPCHDSSQSVSVEEKMRFFFLSTERLLKRRAKDSNQSFGKKKKLQRTTETIASLVRQKCRRMRLCNGQANTFKYRCPYFYCYRKIPFYLFSLLWGMHI